jgi:exodeoxyribonuclease V gamma subunit
MLQGADAARTLRLARAGTELPAGAIGEVQLQRELRALSGFAQRLVEAQREPCLPPHVLTLALAVEGEGWWLQLALADLRPSGLLRWRYGASRATDYLEAWLLHLALCADPPARAAPHTRWLSADGEFGLTPCADATTQLQALLGLYRRGLCAPLHFFPRAAWQFVQQGRNAALAAWASTLQPAFGEGEDPAYRLALRGVDEPLGEDFEALAHAVFGPLREHLQDVRLRA